MDYHFHQVMNCMFSGMLSQDSPMHLIDTHIAAKIVLLSAMSEYDEEDFVIDNDTITMDSKEWSFTINPSDMTKPLSTYVFYGTRKDYGTIDITDTLYTENECTYRSDIEIYASHKLGDNICLEVGVVQSIYAPEELIQLFTENIKKYSITSISSRMVYPFTVPDKIMLEITRLENDVRDMIMQSYHVYNIYLNCYIVRKYGHLINL